MLTRVFAWRGRPLPALPINRRKMIPGWLFHALCFNRVRRLRQVQHLLLRFLYGPAFTIA